MDKNQRPAWIFNVALGIFGLVLALGIIGGVLLTFPQLRPNMITFTVGMGDIFYHQAAWMRPPENPNEILSLHPLEWDENGFRKPHMTAAEYEIVALGDSFTEAANAARPWPDVLASALNTPVLNLGFRGFGPREEMFAFERYGQPEKVKTVVLGLFEGNDLSNVYVTRDHDFEPPINFTNRDMIATDMSLVTERDERYPVMMDINGQTSEIAFLEGYTWGLNGSYETFSGSRNVALLVENLLHIRDMAPQTCFVLAYFPEKGHIYLPYLQPVSRDIVMQKSSHVILDADGALSSEPASLLFDEFLNNRGNQRDAVVEAVTALGIPVIDLTPVFERAAAAGEITYYTYDTHWNQRGHDLAGEAIAAFLRSSPCN